MKVLNVYEFTMKDVYDGLLNEVAHRLNSREVLNDLHKWEEKYPSTVEAIGIPIGGRNLYLSKGVLLRILIVEMDGKVYLSGAITMLGGGIIKELWQDDMGNVVTEMPKLPDDPKAMLLKELEASSLKGSLYTFQYTGDKSKTEAWLEGVRILGKLPEFITEATYGKSSLRLACDYSGTETTTFEGERTTVGIVEWEGKEYSIVTFMFGPLEIVPLIMDNELKRDVGSETYLAIVDLIESAVLEDYPEGTYISRDL